MSVLVVVLILVAWSGLYNVAASRGHWRGVEWLLTFGMRNSVELYAHSVPNPPPLDSADLIILGAGHFHRACANCHGAPGMAPDLSARQSLPPPPDLTPAPKEWSDRQLFWIVKHGIKYTGMPAWVAQDRDDEVWALAAFIKRLPQLDATSYRELALGPVEPATQTGRDIAAAGLSPHAIEACARCHGDERRGPASKLVPILHGQPAEFLTQSLEYFANARRKSGIMQPVAAELDAEAVEKLAQYYSRLKRPPSASGTTSTGRGRALALEGDPAAKIPACITCHGTTSANMFPRLAGQNAAYMANRLRLWKNGVTSPTPSDAIMAPIARLLDETQIEAVTAWFAAEPETGDAVRR
jgi:cytochrome c553